MGTMANSGDPDEMPHKAAFHLGLHCLLGENRSSENFFKIKTCNPSIYTMDLTVSTFMENFIVLKRVNRST